MVAVISDNAMTVLKARYLTNGETPEGMFRRVAGGNEDYFNLMADLRFLPNSPTLFNAGLNNGCTLSACFVLVPEDVMLEGSSSIVEIRSKAIAIAKAGGGVGYYFGNLRPKGSLIKSIHRKACGPVTVLRDYNAINKLITQGGKRDLAQMGVLPVWHDDIREFIHAKDEDPQGLSSFNISVGWTCEWVKRAFAWHDRDLSNAPTADRKAGELWDEQVESAWKTGCPGMFFPDVVNRHNPNLHLGLILAPNPCVTGDTLILTRRGEYRIDSIVGEWTEVWNGLEWSGVVPRVTGHDERVLRVTVDDGRYLDCTIGHGFYLADGTRVNAHQLCVGDYLETYNHPDLVTSQSVRVKSVEDRGFVDTVYCFTEPLRGRGVFNGILTAQCGETPNRNGEPCNLGSLNLSHPRYVNRRTREVNWDALYEDAYLAECFLDDILDRNTFPHPDITTAAMLTRKLGLGVMGWADMLSLLHIHYDTQEAVDLGGMVMKCISEGARKASSDMAVSKGPYGGYDPDRTVGPCLRNETGTSIAPTGTIALIAGCSSSIEPHFALEWERTTKEGIKLKERIPVWDDLEGFVPKTANDIAPEWHVQHQAAFQKFTDLGVSKTVNLPNSATKEDVSKIYRMMYETGCKGGTIFRDGCRNEQVLVSKKSTSVFTVHSKPKRSLPSSRPGVTHKFHVGGTTGFLTANSFEDGSPAEIFLRVSKIGSTVSGLLDTWAISFSIALQNGTPLEDLCKHHKGTRFEPCGMTDSKEIPVCTSIPDYVVRWLEMNFVKGTTSDVSKGKGTGSGQLCPDCGAEAVFQAGCLTCQRSGCGWSKCG